MNKNRVVNISKYFFLLLFLLFFGSIMRIDAIQSKLEAGILYNDLVNLETEWKNSLSQLTYMTGISINDTLLCHQVISRIPEGFSPATIL
jgi:cobalt-zinc-cadmium efflux system outer membrane protein